MSEEGAERNAWKAGYLTVRRSWKLRFGVGRAWEAWVVDSGISIMGRCMGGVLGCVVCFGISTVRLVGRRAEVAR